ncbi:MAG TPA: hypothetical protein VFV68_03030 [Agriterribacter sp.]|nr:hypothetical protein [Agriterribacter sp.]
MIRLKRTKAFLLALMLATVTYGQQYDRIVAELDKIRNSYSDSGYNSYTIRYQYAMESAPGKVLDTLSAFFRMKGGKYYCRVAQMEFVQDDSINAAIYHNEKTIVLTNAAISTEKGRLMIDSWDSTFVSTNIDSVAVTGNSTNRTLNFYFVPGSAYGNCSITYNKETYRPQKITYVQRATQNYKEGAEKPDGIIISILFSAFNKTAFNENLFDYKKFVRRQNKSWSATADFTSYTIVNNVYVE